MDSRKHEPGYENAVSETCIDPTGLGPDEAPGGRLGFGRPEVGEERDGRGAVREGPVRPHSQERKGDRHRRIPSGAGAWQATTKPASSSCITGASSVVPPRASRT